MGCGNSRWDVYTGMPTDTTNVYATVPKGINGFGIATSGTGTEWSGFELFTLEQHNVLRVRHSSPHLRLNRELCERAQCFADDLTRRGVIVHSSLEDRCFRNVQCGENLYSNSNITPNEVTVIGSMVTISADAATCSWYCESCLYDFSKDGIQEGTANFTQMVWKDTSEFGVAATFGRQGALYAVTVVALYWPTGNYLSRMTQNVLPAVDIEGDDEQEKNTNANDTCHAIPSNLLISNSNNLLFLGKPMLLHENNVNAQRDRSSASTSLLPLRRKRRRSKKRVHPENISEDSNIPVSKQNGKTPVHNFSTLPQNVWGLDFDILPPIIDFSNDSGYFEDR